MIEKQYLGAAQGAQQELKKFDTSRGAQSKEMPACDGSAVVSCLLSNRLLRVVPPIFDCEFLLISIVFVYYRAL